MKFKPLFIIVLLAVLLSVSSVFASGHPLDIDDSTKDYTKENAQFVKDGQKSIQEYYNLENHSELLDSSIFSVPGATEYINLSMVHYFQNNQPWSGYKMQTCGTSIGLEGCALTSFAMVLDYYGYNDDPGTVNSTLGNSACPFEWTTNGSLYNLRLVGNEHKSVTDTYAKDFIRGALRTNKPVIVGFVKSNGNETHFVVAYGYLEEENSPTEGLFGRKYYYIKDPAHQRNYKFLDDYLNAGWSINRLKVYGR